MKKKKPRYNKGKIKRLRERVRQSQDLPPMNRKKRPMSNLEQRVADLLDDLKISYEREVPLKYPGSGFRYYDFCLYDYGVLIEVDGAYWHGERTKIDYSSLMAKKNDMTKNCLAKKSGYNLIRIKEKEINEGYEGVKNTILNVVKENRDE